MLGSSGARSRSQGLCAFLRHCSESFTEEEASELALNFNRFLIPKAVTGNRHHLLHLGCARFPVLLCPGSAASHLLGPTGVAQ